MRSGTKFSQFFRIFPTYSSINKTKHPTGMKTGRHWIIRAKANTKNKVELESLKTDIKYQPVKISKLMGT